MTRADFEWHRVRVRKNIYACNRYSWLRPGDARQIAFAASDSWQLVHVGYCPTLRKLRTRAPRIDEAQAVLDVQFPIDDLHPIDREKAHMIRLYFGPQDRMLTRHASEHAYCLQIAITKQHLGVRHWWACPGCGRAARYLYYYEVGHRAGLHDEEDCVLACRKCLGLTYASRSRNRCRDHDRRLALQGDLQAAMRVLMRVQRQEHSDLATIEAIRSRIQRQVREHGVGLLPYSTEIGPTRDYSE